MEQELLETNVPQDLNADKFQAMVAHMTVPHNLTFSKHDNIPLSHPHNTPLHIEVLVYKHRVKRLLIDGRAGLNICTLKLIRALGFSEKSIDPCKKITIKAYDDEERSSKGTVMLPIQVGSIQRDTMCQVLDIDLTYNILLGQPWIHEMQVVPSTYHQCVKFPYNGQEISISADHNPFRHCNAMGAAQDSLVPHNREKQSYSAPDL